MTARSTRPGGMGTQTFHGLTGEAGFSGREEGETAGVFERGLRLGRYLVLGLLGRGGMGEVYVAYDPELDRKVALKMLYGGWSAGRESQLRLLHEAQAAARLTHPNVVRIYDVGSVGDRIFVAMELIDGVDLAAWTRAEPRSWREVLRVFREAGLGLAAAHAAGLVHRDFKPGNVLVAGDGRVVVADFGLALDVGPPDAPPDAASGAATGETAARLAGTPAYMAPEQLRGEPVDARADQFGFCAALFEALYGEPPFAGAAPAELLQAIESRAWREPPSPSRAPAWLRRVIVRGLAAAPAERHPSMAALLAALQRDPAAQRRRWLGAAALLGLAGALVVGWSRWQAREDLLCRGAERKLAGIWDDVRRAEIRTALKASGRPYALQAWPRVAQILDDYSRDWIAFHTEACEATQLRGEQSTQMLDLQVACLDDRLLAVRAATDLLARADAQVAGNAVAVARGLPALSECSDRRALMAVEPFSTDPATQKRISRIRDVLARGRVLESAGRYSEALALAEEATRTADASGDRPRAAEARLLLATTNGRKGRADAMESTLLDAVDLAQESRHDRVLAQALTLLILASDVRGDPERARLWGRLAGSALKRIGTPGEIAADRRFYLGIAANMEQQPEQAIEHFQASLALAARAGSRKSTHTAFNNIGIALNQLGRFDEAADHLRRALQILERNFGPDHPDVGGMLYQLGKVERSRGDLASALRYYQRSLALDERLEWRGSDLGFPLTGLGETLIDLGRAAEALPLLERAVRLRSQHTFDPAQLALSRFQLARALDATGRSTAARREALKARELFAQLGGRARSDREQVESWIAAHGGGS